MFARARRSDARVADSPAPRSRTRSASVNPTWLKLATSLGPGVQRKPELSKPADSHERAADAAADRATRDGGPVPYDAASSARAASPGGAPLPSALRSHFEPRLGQDLGAVRVHADREAADLAAGISAQAFTVGEHVAFGEGRYAPHTRSGQRLIAHELAHVLQQRSGTADGTQRVLDDEKKPEDELGGVVQRKEKPASETETVGTVLWLTDAEGKPRPTITDVSQGGLKDCYLFAALAAIVVSDPQKIVDMIKDNRNGTYTVTFKGIGVFSSATQTVSARFEKGKHGDATASGAFWPLIVEKAYAQQLGGIPEIDKARNAGDTVNDFINVGPSRFDPREKDADYIMGKFKQAKDKHYPTTLNTPKPDKVSEEKKTLAAPPLNIKFNHAYVLEDIDPERKRVKLYNPWGDRHPNGDGWVDIPTIRKFFISVAIND